MARSTFNGRFRREKRGSKEFVVVVVVVVVVVLITENLRLMVMTMRMRTRMQKYHILGLFLFLLPCRRRHRYHSIHWYYHSQNKLDLKDLELHDKIHHNHNLLIPNWLQYQHHQFQIDVLTPTPTPIVSQKERDSEFQEVKLWEQLDIYVLMLLVLVSRNNFLLKSHPYEIQHTNIIPILF